MLEAILRKATDSEPGFSRKKVKWAISCTSDGRFTGVIQLDEGRGRIFDRCPNLSQPELVGGNETRAHFLAERLDAVALYWKDDLAAKDQARFRAKHAYFCMLLKKAASSASYLTAAARMLRDEETLQAIRQDLARQKAKPTETATVLVDGANPLEGDDWHGWWRQFRSTLRPPSLGGNKMRCFATGGLVEPAKTHPKIEGLPGEGNNATGDVLIGFDKEAFQSYGLEQSANAAMSEETATAYTEALNQLISEKGVKLGNALEVYWFTKAIPQEDDLLAWLNEPLEQTEASAELKAKELLRAIQSGQRSDLANNRYIALLLSGRTGRVMVRDWMEGRFEDLACNIEAWFADLRIVARDGNGQAYDPKFMAVCGALVRELKDLPSPTAATLWKVAVQRLPIPQPFMARALSRFRCDLVKDEPFNHARMGLIKAYFIRLKPGGDLTMTASYNPDHPSPAYHCGGLLAVLANLQRAALGDVGAGVVQRFYVATSQSPGLILGRLVSNARNHLAKLEAGLAWWYEERIAEIMTKLGDAAPRILDLEGQGLFALGYYQKLAELRAGNKKASPESKPEKGAKT